MEAQTHPHRRFYHSVATLTRRVEAQEGELLATTLEGLPSDSEGRPEALGAIRHEVFATPTYGRPPIVVDGELAVRLEDESPHPEVDLGQTPGPARVPFGVLPESKVDVLSEVALVGCDGEEDGPCFCRRLRALEEEYLIWVRHDRGQIGNDRIVPRDRLLLGLLGRWVENGSPRFGDRNEKSHEPCHHLYIHESPIWIQVGPNWPGFWKVRKRSYSFGRVGVSP